MGFILICGITKGWAGSYQMEGWNRDFSFLTWVLLYFKKSSEVNEITKGIKYYNWLKYLLQIKETVQNLHLIPRKSHGNYLRFSLKISGKIKLNTGMTMSLCICYTEVFLELWQEELCQFKGFTISKCYKLPSLFASVLHFLDSRISVCTDTFYSNNNQIHKSRAAQKMNSVLQKDYQLGKYCRATPLTHKCTRNH